MSTPFISQPSGASPQAPAYAPLEWAQPERQAAFYHWLDAQASAHGVLPATVRAASADASFRRYFRVDTSEGSCIVMDAPPDKENCEPFVRIARLMLDAGLYAPRILAWDEPQGFMLLDDIGSHTMMEAINRDDSQANHSLYMRALDALLALQQSSRPGVLPAYDDALLRRELSLFPDWYLTQHRQLHIDTTQRATPGRSAEVFNTWASRRIDA
jgi:aminoglycoside/choline kinase family phosphotransferase